MGSSCPHDFLFLVGFFSSDEVEQGEDRDSGEAGESIKEVSASDIVPAPRYWVLMCVLKAVRAANSASIVFMAVAD